MVGAAILVVVIISSIVLSALVMLRSRSRFFDKSRFDWASLFCVVVCGSIVFVSLMAYSAYAGFLYFFFFVPVFLTCLILMVAAAVHKRSGQSLLMLLTLVAFLGVSWTLLESEGTIRPSIRWQLWSHRFKAEVLAQRAPSNGELRHIEWDGWGGLPVGDWTAYVVFDPSDSLSLAAKSRSHGKVSGIPCDVDRVRRLEPNWYSVEFSMNEWWDQCERSY